MKYRYIGNEKVSSLGLGCMGLAEFYGCRTDTDAADTIALALDCGVNLLDTADMYGNGHSERLVGNAIKNSRKSVFVSTKVGFVRSTDDVTKMQLNGTPKHIFKACEGSLSRLGTDYIDIYFLHRVDPNVPVEETIGAISQLVTEGKVKYIGMSDASIDNLIRASNVHPISVYQTEYSLWHRDPEYEITDLCKKLNITFMPYSPLGRGFLSGKIRNDSLIEDNDFRKILPRFQGDNLKNNIDLIKKLEEFSNIINCSLAQLSLAWLLHKNLSCIPIPGAKKPIEMKENLECLKIKLSTSDMNYLDSIMPIGCAYGNQYPDNMTIK